MRIGLDTNIVLRNAIQNDPEHELVSAALQRLVQSGWELCICVQNVVEFWVVATRPTNVNGLGLTAEQTCQEVAVILAAYTLLHDPPDVLESWLDLCSRYAVSGRTAHDTRLVATILGHGLTHLLTLNSQDFVRYNEITCLTPQQVP